MNPWDKLKELPLEEQEERVLKARKATIAEKETAGGRYGRAVERGILGGQWDGGSVVGKHLF